MSTTAQEAFEKYYDQLDPYGPNRGTQQIFIDGFNAGSAQLAALKEENERLMRLHADTCIKAGDEITTLKARVAELERALALMLKVHDLSDSPDGDVTRIARAALKEPANEGGRDAS